MGIPTLAGEFDLVSFRSPPRRRDHDSFHIPESAEAWPLSGFRHRCLQDLAWAIGSPPVISGEYEKVRWLDKGWCQQELSDCASWLLELDKRPEALLGEIEQLKSRRLGEYFECLVSFWLKHSPNTRLLHQNHQLQDDQRTLGEADFIFEYLPSGRIIHLEVAVKFYMGGDRPDDMSYWFGPGLRDRLDQKFRHLVDRQTQLSCHYPELMPVAVDERWCLLKGRMFYPSCSYPATVFFADDHPRGLWISESANKNLESSSGWLPLDKSEWLSEFPRLDEVMRGRLTHTLSTEHYPRCYARMDAHGETGRVFLLPDDFWQRAFAGAWKNP